MHQTRVLKEIARGEWEGGDIPDDACPQGAVPRRVYQLEHYSAAANEAGGTD